MITSWRFEFSCHPKHQHLTIRGWETELSLLHFLKSDVKNKFGWKIQADALCWKTKIYFSSRHEHVLDRLPEPGLGLGLVLPASGSGSECPSGFEKRPSAELQQNLSPPWPAGTENVAAVSHKCLQSLPSSQKDSKNVSVLAAAPDVFQLFPTLVLSWWR